MSYSALGKSHSFAGYRVLDRNRLKEVFGLHIEDNGWMEYSKGGMGATHNTT